MENLDRIKQDIDKAQEQLEHLDSMTSKLDELIDLFEDGFGFGRINPDMVNELEHLRKTKERLTYERWATDQWKLDLELDKVAEFERQGGGYTYAVTVFMPVGGEKTMYEVDSRHEAMSLAQTFSLSWCNEVDPYVFVYEVHRGLTPNGTKVESRGLEGKFLMGMEEK